MNWYKKAQGYIANNLRVEYPYSLLEQIAMTGDEGLDVIALDFDELLAASELEKAGIIRKILKTDDGRYTAYVINKAHKPNFEKSKAYALKLKLENLVDKITKGQRDWTPEELELQQNHSQEIEEMLKEKARKVAV